MAHSEVQLKVIDWDSAQFLHHDLPDLVSDRLGPRRKGLMKKVADRNHMEPTSEYYDLSLIQVLETHLNEPYLRQREKTALDEAFIAAQYRFINE